MHDVQWCSFFSALFSLQRPQCRLYSRVYSAEPTDRFQSVSTSCSVWTLFASRKVWNSNFESKSLLMFVCEFERSAHKRMCNIVPHSAAVIHWISRQLEVERVYSLRNHFSLMKSHNEIVALTPPLLRESESEAAPSMNLICTSSLPFVLLVRHRSFEPFESKILHQLQLIRTKRDSPRDSVPNRFEWNPF